MPLIFGEPDQTYTISQITGKDEVRSHLKRLGITEQESITIKQSIAGNLIVEIRGIRLALDRTLARRIQIGA